MGSKISYQGPPGHHEMVSAATDPINNLGGRSARLGDGGREPVQEESGRPRCVF